MTNSVGFRRQISSFLSLSVFAQLLTISTHFILARWYGAEAVGELRIFTAVVLTFSVLVNGGFDLAIMLPKNNEAAWKLQVIGRRIGLGLACCFMVIILIENQWLADLLNAQILGSWFYLLPISMLMEGLMNARQQLLARMGLFNKISSVFLIRAVSFSVPALLLSIGNMSVANLLIAWLASQTIAFLSMTYISSIAYKKVKKRQNNELKEIAKEYKDFPIYHLGSTATNLASKELVTLSLSVFYGPAVYAIFSIANQILGLPMRLVLQSVQQFFYQRVAKAKQISKEEVRKETVRVVYLLLIISAIPTLILAIMGPNLFAWLLGESWRDSGVYIKWLAAFSIVSAVVAPITSLVNVSLKLRNFFLFNIVLLASRFLAIFIGYKIGDAELAIALYGTVAFIGASILLVWMLNLAGIFSFKGLKGDSRNNT